MTLTLTSLLVAILLVVTTSLLVAISSIALLVREKRASTSDNLTYWSKQADFNDSVAEALQKLASTDEFLLDSEESVQ